jgi:hypothetical protein
LIVDTGSGIAAFPCKSTCNHCGQHLNPYFDLEKSDSEYLYSCVSDGNCQCVQDNKCSFSSSYGEGSSYNGYLVKDMIHFGEPYHPIEDAFNFTFGCVT